jgi:methylmalonyl-CoA carboxyltransferase 5S subunit
MFPQVAAKFLAQRAEGPKNVSKKPADTAAAAKPAAAAKSTDGKGPVTIPVTYAIKVGDKSHQVTVEPA